jgi:excisionase family DNA binding protein
MTKLLTTADAARLLGVVPATVRQMERSGRLPAQRTTSGMRLFRRADVERLLADRQQDQIQTTIIQYPSAKGEENA